MVDVYAIKLAPMFEDFIKFVFKGLCVFDCQNKEKMVINRV